jgi:hypothetical protein
VLEMLDRRAKQKTDITEQELQAIAKAMYEERLAEVCTLQRSTPYDVEDHSAANLAFIDYFERLKNQGAICLSCRATSARWKRRAGARSGSPICAQSLQCARSAVLV